MNKKILVKIFTIWLVITGIVLLTSTDISGDQTTFSSGTAISSTDMNANFDALFDLTEGNIDSSNLASDSASLSKVSGGVISESGGDISSTGIISAQGFFTSGIIRAGTINSYDFGFTPTNEDIIANSDVYTNGAVYTESGLYCDSDIFCRDFLQVGEAGNDGEIGVVNSNNIRTLRLQSDWGTGGNLEMFDENGISRIEIEASTSGGIVTVNGTQVHDYAEVFELSNKRNIEPGMVVVIDPDNPGNLKLSSESYDKKVAGIISGAGGASPGFIVGTREDDTNDKPVALSGRVYCYVDAAYGGVEVGDLLTTASTPGYAMKASDYTKSPGAILGKAMEPLSGGKGLILVLVTLQ